MAKKRKCGNCGKRTGHNARTCSAKRAKKSGKKSAIRRYSSGSVTRSRQGYCSFGKGSGWVMMWHGGRTGATQHDKTWSIKLAKKGSGWTVVTRHGRRTGAKNETSRGAMSKEAAIKLGNSLIRQKLRKGYMISGANR